MTREFELLGPVATALGWGADTDGGKGGDSGDSSGSFADALGPVTDSNHASHSSHDEHHGHGFGDSVVHGTIWGNTGREFLHAEHGSRHAKTMEQSLRHTAHTSPTGVPKIPWLNAVTGPLSMYSGYKQFTDKNASTTDKIAGISEAGAGSAGTTSLASAIIAGATNSATATAIAGGSAGAAGVLGAGAAGYALGKSGNEAWRKLGLFGKQNANYGDPRKNRDWSDVSADAGRWVRDKLGGGTAGKILGGGTTIATSILGAGATAGMGAWNTASNLGKGLASGASDAFSSVTGLGLQEFGPDPKLLDPLGTTTSKSTSGDEVPWSPLYQKVPEHSWGSN